VPRAGAEVTVTTSAHGENGSRVPASCENSSGGRTSRERRGGPVLGQGAAPRCDPKVRWGGATASDGGRAGGEEIGQGKREGGREMTCGPRMSEREEKRGRVLVLGQAGCAREGERQSEEALGLGRGRCCGPGKREERHGAEGEREGEVSGPAWPMREKGRGKGELGWAKGFGLLSFLLLSLFFSILKHSNKTIRVQINLNSNPIHSTPITQCSSVNAQAS
jgi:hypothetical protein